MSERTQVSMLDFIRAHENSNSIAEVAEATGLTEASVQARASKYRNPEYEMTPKRDSEGNIVFKTDDGSETTDESEAKLNSQGKPIRVMIRALRNGQPIVKREAIPLKKFPKGGGSRVNVDEALALLAELRGETETVS
jgi:hypothetical protein